MIFFFRVCPNNFKQYLKNRNRVNKYVALNNYDEKEYEESHLDLYLDRAGRYNNTIFILDSSTSKEDATENCRVVVLRSILTRWEIDGCPNVFIVDGGFNALQSHHPEMLTNPDVELAPDDPRYLNQSAINPNFEYPLWYWRCWYKPEDIPKNIKKKIDKFVRKIQQKEFGHFKKHLTLPSYDMILKRLEEYSEKVLLGAHLSLENYLVALNKQYLGKIQTDNTLKLKEEYEILYTKWNKKREEYLGIRERYEEKIKKYDGIEKYACNLYPISQEQLNRRDELMLQIENYKDKIAQVYEVVKLFEIRIKEVEPRVAVVDFARELQSWIEILQEQMQKEQQYLDLHKQFLNHLEIHKTGVGFEDFFIQKKELESGIEDAWNKRFNIKPKIISLKEEYELNDATVETEAETLVQDIEKIHEETKSKIGEIITYKDKFLVVFNNKEKSQDNKANVNDTATDAPVATTREKPEQSTAVIEPMSPSAAGPELTASDKHETTSTIITTRALPKVSRRPVINKQIEVLLEPLNVNKRYRHAIGLSNIDNTCYMNCIIQCLNNIKKFSNYFLKYKGNSPLAIAMSEVIQQVKKRDGSDDKPSLKKLKVKNIYFFLF